MKLVFPLLLLAVGEGLMIYGELAAARVKEGFSSVFVWSTVLAIIGAVTLIIAYVWGYRVLQNIWIVAAVSITSILIIEPILAYTMFHEIPTRGALVGLILGALGFAVTLLY